MFSMPFGWPVLVVLTTLALVAAVGVALRSAPSGRGELWMASALVFFALLATPVLVAGYTQQLYPGRLAIASAALFSGALLVSARKVGLRAHLGRVVRSIGSLAKLPLDGVRAAVRARSLVTLGLLCVAAMVAYAAWLSYLAPSEGWDGLFYHEPMVGFAIQNHGFSVVDLPMKPMTQQINGFPRGCQSVALWFVVFTDRTFMELGGVLAAPCLVVATYALTRRYGERVTSMAWGVLAVLIPAMWGQVRTAQIDIQVAFFVVAALYYATRPEYRVRDAVLATLALTLIAESKGTVLTLAPPIALVAYVRLLFHHVRRRPAASLVTAVAGSLVIAGAAAVWLLRNVHAFHNPLWPLTIDVKVLRIHFAGIIDFPTFSPPVPFNEMVSTLYGIPIVGRDDINPRNYGYAITWVVFPLAAIAFVALVLATLRDIVFFRRLGTPWNLFVVAMLGVVAAAAASTWTNARFLMQPIVTCMALVGWLGSRRRWSRLGDGAASAAIVLAIVPFFWMDGWFGGITFKQVSAMMRVPRKQRVWMNPDVTSVPFETARAREIELGPGDRVAFTSDETWLATLWNNRFSNIVEYAPFDDAEHFLDRVKDDKWVVVGGGSDARKALDSRPKEWQLVGDATPHDQTVAFRRRL